MTPGDFKDLVYPAIRSRWPFIRWDTDTMIACAQDIGNIDAETAVMVITLMSKEGQKHPPTGGQIYAKAVQLLRKDKPAPKGEGAPTKAAPVENEAPGIRWDKRVGVMREAMKIVLDCEAKGVLCDPRAYPSHLTIDLNAALLRREYDRSIARGRFIGYDNHMSAEKYAAMLLAKAKAQGRTAVPAQWLGDGDVRAALAEIIRTPKGEVADADGSVYGADQPVEALPGESANA